MVRETGLEPVRDHHTPLKRARLPIPPLSLDLAEYIIPPSSEFVNSKLKFLSVFVYGNLNPGAFWLKSAQF